MMDLNWGSTTSISGVVEEHPAEQEIEKELTVSLGRSALFALHCEALTTANPIVKEESPISEEAAFSISDLAALHGTTVSGDAYSASPDSKLTLDADPFSNSFTQSLGMRSLSATVVGSSRQNESGAVPGPWNGRCGQFSGKDKRTTVMRKSDPNRYLVSSLVENALNLHDIVVGKDKRTAVMLKNVPNRYTQEMLMDFINETHKGTYDFFYLRMDFVNNCNVGYAFINFIDPLSIVSFSARVTGQRWPKFNSAKLPVLVPAKIKTKAQFIEQFRNSPVMLEPQAYRPRLFHSSGPSAGLPMPFPGPTAEGVRARSGVLFSRVI
ncbi:RNA recognition motif 2-domain-containing protein [Chytriomyces sp. MP71]|nr:RNA recognition motif 2-domain-containing protein [Chytriomyces sp. MP71]